MGFASPASQAAPVAGALAGVHIAGRFPWVYCTVGAGWGQGRWGVRGGGKDGVLNTLQSAPAGLLATCGCHPPESGGRQLSIARGPPEACEKEILAVLGQRG